MVEQSKLKLFLYTNDVAGSDHCIQTPRQTSKLNKSTVVTFPVRIAQMKALAYEDMIDQRIALDSASC